MKNKPIFLAVLILVILTVLGFYFQRINLNNIVLIIVIGFAFFVQQFILFWLNILTKKNLLKEFLSPLVLNVTIGTIFGAAAAFFYSPVGTVGLMYYTIVIGMPIWIGQEIIFFSIRKRNLTNKEI